MADPPRLSPFDLLNFYIDDDTTTPIAAIVRKSMNRDGEVSVFFFREANRQHCDTVKWTGSRWKSLWPLSSPGGGPADPCFKEYGDRLLAGRRRRLPRASPYFQEPTR